MTQLPCPYLNAAVELTDEREAHIREKHPELLPQHRDYLINSLLFSRWFPDVKGGKFVVVVVVADPPPTDRYWIVTAYVARQLSGGTVTWTRP
jgi:hypothetical protein